MTYSEWNKHLIKNIKSAMNPERVPPGQQAGVRIDNQGHPHRPGLNNLNQQVLLNEEMRQDGGMAEEDDGMIGGGRNRIGQNLLNQGLLEQPAPNLGLPLEQIMQQDHPHNVVGDANQVEDELQQRPQIERPEDRIIDEARRRLRRPDIPFQPGQEFFREDFPMLRNANPQPQNGVNRLRQLPNLANPNVFAGLQAPFEEHNRHNQMAAGMIQRLPPQNAPADLVDQDELMYS